MPTLPHSPVARARVLESYRAGGDWMLLATHHGISLTAARRIVDSGHAGSDEGHDQVRLRRGHQYVHHIRPADRHAVDTQAGASRAIDLQQ
ncbi:hypothetical protein C6341_g14101 [Phytophthora cactorum]|nr:hypothetical protein C6341_g14101 [Phytophthora cactorum]